MAAIPSTREAQGSPLLQHTQSSHPGSVNRVLARKIPESAPKHPLCELKELFEKKAPPATKENLFKAIERLERIFPGIIKDVTKEYEKSNELVAGISSSESVSQLKNCFETVVRKNIENRDDARTIYLTVASHLQSRGFERDKIVDGKKRLFENYEHLANVLSTPINVTSVGRSLNPLDTIQNNITSEDKEGIINCLKEIDAQIPDFRNSVLAAYYQKFTEHPGDMGNWGEDHVHEYPDQLREVINNHIRSLRDNLGKDQELFGDKLQSGSLDNWGEFFVAYVATQEELQEASRTEHSPIGLQNISANCWINSVLQLFLNTELSAFLEGSPKEGVQQFKARYERDKTTKQKISQANSQEIRELLATPAGISNNPNIHEDAHEGFMLLLPENADHRLSFTTQTTRTYQNNQSVSADPEARFALHLDLHPEH
ncbi:MAG: hypothetical protein KAR79_02020, partial [Simkaniaceae bacterium]|nr:hypothetical protein [Simkaniaceae bacterium]